MSFYHPLTLGRVIAIGLSRAGDRVRDVRRRRRAARPVDGRCRRTRRSGALLARDRAAGAGRAERCNATDQRQQLQIEGGVRRVALLRYDAFEDVGGRLSFSCALLDEHGTGVVLTSINGRQETRVYAKPIDAGDSSLQPVARGGARRSARRWPTSSEAVEAR